MSKIITIDTNLLLDDANIIYKLSSEYDQIIVTSTILKELDKHKYNPNLSYSARKAIRTLQEFKNNFPSKIKFYIDDACKLNNDSWIIEAAKDNNSDLATKDISMSIIAESEGVNTILYDVVLNGIYDPYNYVTIEQLYEKADIVELERFYGKSNYPEILNIFSDILKKELDPQAWFFIFVKTESNVLVYANHPIKEYLTRIDHHKHYNEIKCDGTVIKAKDIYQNCAIYCLREAPNVLITGKWGSGKSLLTTAYSIEANDRKTFITRPPVGINAKYEIGFLPGSKEEKLLDWLGGFLSSVYYIYGNTNGPKHSGFNFVKDEIFSKKFEVLSLNSIQGISLLEDDILIVDEIQLISIDYMSQILSRPSSGSKLILTGDLKQTYSIVKPSESGLLKLLRLLPHKSIAYVNLESTYRSDILELADKLQDKTIC